MLLESFENILQTEYNKFSFENNNEVKKKIKPIIRKYCEKEREIVLNDLISLSPNSISNYMVSKREYLRCLEKTNLS